MFFGQMAFEQKVQSSNDNEQIRLINLQQQKQIRILKKLPVLFFAGLGYRGYWQ
jgi:hypothetical protein